MRRIAPTIVLLAVLCGTPTASAKGPTHAEISGPGLSHPIVFNGFGEPGASSSFGRLVDGLGFFPAMFGQQPSPMLAGRPGGQLGPRYTVRYRVPTGSGRATTIVQALYPFANGGAVAYTGRNQTLFGTTVHGGWFRALPGVKPLLVARGLPATAQGHGGGGVARWAVPAGALLVAAAAAAFALARLRRRPQPRPA